MSLLKVEFACWQRSTLNMLTHIDKPQPLCKANRMQVEQAGVGLVYGSPYHCFGIVALLCLPDGIGATHGKGLPTIHYFCRLAP